MALTAALLTACVPPSRAGGAGAAPSSDAGAGDEIPETPPCDEALSRPSGDCDPGLQPAQIYCWEEQGGVDLNWICVVPAAEGQICRSGNYYADRPCAEGLTCVNELWVSRCRAAGGLVPCADSDACPGGQRCYGYHNGNSVCAPGQGLWEECTSFSGPDLPPGATEASIQGSCGAGLSCMTGDWSGDFNFCLPSSCDRDQDCGEDPLGFWRAGCILDEEAGPGRVGGCAAEVEVGGRCAWGSSPHDGQACAEGSRCGALDAEMSRFCVE